MSISDKEKLTRKRIRELKKRAEDLGLREDEIKSLFCLDPSKTNYNTFTRTLKTKIVLRRFLENLFSFCKALRSKKSICALLVLTIGYMMSLSSDSDLRTMIKEQIKAPCIIPLPDYVTEIVRPRVPCEICQSLDRFPVVENISREEFTSSYAYTGVPVLIKGAIEDWGALHSFDYQYFKTLYQGSSEALDIVEEYCQFFPYQTEFESLGHVFNMTDDRAALKNGTRPWYVGWSNCQANTNDVGVELRSQYSRPYFLPRHSSNMDTDWIFMGGPGFGAGMHAYVDEEIKIIKERDKQIDVVDRPSWQAQVSGTKTWLLEPSPECWNQCQRLEVTVEKGDIIVLDTNIWYHSTRVNPGNISITIGAEYD